MDPKDHFTNSGDIHFDRDRLLYFSKIKENQFTMRYKKEIYTTIQRIFIKNIINHILIQIENEELRQGVEEYDRGLDLDGIFTEIETYQPARSDEQNADVDTNLETIFNEFRSRQLLSPLESVDQELNMYDELAEPPSKRRRIK